MIQIVSYKWKEAVLEVSNAEYQLTEKEKSDYFNDLLSITHKLCDDANNFIRLAEIIARQHLKADALCLHHNLLYQKGFLLIRNLPIDPQLPHTPDDGWRPNGKTYISEAVLLGIVSALKYQPFSFLQEKQGKLVHEIAPVKNLAHTISSNGTVSFDFHTDGAYLTRTIRPHILALMCLRNTGNTPTKISRLGCILKNMEPKFIQELLSPSFLHHPPTSFEDNNIVKAPVLKCIDDKIEIAVSTHNVEPLTKKAKAALSQLRQIADEVRIEINWQPGDLLIFNNLRCLHARGQTTGDRWLQRCYGSQDIDTSRIIDLSAETTFSPSPN